MCVSLSVCLSLSNHLSIYLIFSQRRRNQASLQQRLQLVRNTIFPFYYFLSSFPFTGDSIRLSILVLLESSLSVFYLFRRYTPMRVPNSLFWAKTSACYTDLTTRKLVWVKCAWFGYRVLLKELRHGWRVLKKMAMSFAIHLNPLHLQPS